MKYSIFSLVDHYDDSPVGIKKQYKEVQEQIELADSLNFDTFWLAEHHFQNEHGSIASPAVFLSSVSRTTSNIGLGTAVSVLPLHNPIRVAEDFAMLDIISNGRMKFAVGSGYLPHEFEGFNIEFEDRVKMLDESSELIFQLWSQKHVTFQGEYHQFDGGLNVRPVQKLKKPLMATIRNEAIQAMARQGIPIFMSALSVRKIDEVKQMVEGYHDTYDKSKYPKEDRHVAYCLNLVLDQDEEFAKQRGIKALQKLFNNRGIKRTPENFMESGLCFFGTPEQASRIMTSYIESGITELVLSVGFGGIEHEYACRTMELFAKEVLPQLKKIERPGLYV